MPAITTIATLPGDNEFHRFEALPKRLYPEDSIRHKIGHELSTKHLQSCYVVQAGNRDIGRFALYHNPDLSKTFGKRTGTIGCYECVNNLSSARWLLEAAVRVADAVHKFEYLIGPMEGSTWNSYRFSEHNDWPNFFMEPYHHAYYNEHFQNAGFEPIAHYTSNFNDDLDAEIPGTKAFEQKARAAGAKFRQLNLDNFEDEIRRIGTFSIEAFKDNYLYTPITTEEFMAKYIPLKAYMKPELIWMCEDQNDELHAIMFGIPDYFDPKGKTFIIKSLARKKDTPFKGVGGYLISKVTESAKALGFTSVVHALMYVDNVSLQVSENYAGEVYKKYVLYGLKI